jgi:hypothetical protein
MNATAGLVLLVLLLAVTGPVVAAPPLQDPSEVEVEGTLEEVDLEAGFIVVGGVTVYLGDETLVRGGRGRGVPATLEDLEPGVWVAVSGLEQPDGTILATRIRIKVGRHGEDDDGEPPDGFRHPIADRLSTYYGLDYDELMRMHEEGIGFGLVMKAYLVASTNPEAGLSGEELLEMRLSGLGWGEIWHETGAHPGQGRPPWAGQGHDGAAGHPGKGRPPWAGEGQGGAAGQPGRGRDRP